MRGKSKAVVIGVDVGTASVRAGIFDLRGKMLSSATHPIAIFRPEEDFVEQSSRNIWTGVGKTVKKAMRDAGASSDQVVGIGFDATCSLVALDANDQPITISTSRDSERNIIVWMDHRAKEQAGRINATGHRVLKYVGGQLSPEQEPPKLLWIKENLPRTWAKAAKFMDLADFLTYQATRNDVRSMCTTVCKWTYLGHEGPSGSWDKSFFQQVNLADLFEGDRAGKAVSPLGKRAGELTSDAARDLGLRPGIPVAVGIIDAHAGGIGVLGMSKESRKSPVTPEELEQRVALIGGTSSCHMAVSREPYFIPGIWGPYYSAMIPGLWLTEGGQSATGALIDYLIDSHSAGTVLRKRAAREKQTVYELLNATVSRLARGLEIPAQLTRELHVLPYFHGNRSPRANPHLKGMVSGLTLDSSPEALARIYYAGVQAVAYGTRHIIEEMNKGGYRINRIYACGGGTKNRLWLQEHADITGCEILLPREPEAVLLGSAILGAVAAGCFDSVLEGMHAMSRCGKTITPNPKTRTYHDAKYKIFHRMYDHQMEYKELIRGEKGTGNF
jgi:FGGY-family pentulose kinase